ncbi:hypothetical protein HOF65_07930 [bacterium]|nr:hypothetical protein [bacterium]MBT3853820.1 hypothetical protein [bacterium]MBT6779388.1 hypothetical protein [bacterium]
MLFAISFIHTALPVGGHSLRVSKDTKNHSDSNFLISLIIKASISNTFLIHSSCLILDSSSST